MAPFALSLSKCHHLANPSFDRLRTSGPTPHPIILSLSKDKLRTSGPTPAPIILSLSKDKLRTSGAGWTRT